ncbi:MAG TPA: hypothetical protein VFX84_02695 [Candidatus Saccharimonadales bacterium]|nr:hypothetical protein [Candidatus Saccharimonadales bacterium]
MTELFKANPGTVFRLDTPELGMMQDLAGQLLQQDLFRCYGLYEGMMSARVTELLKHLGGVSSAPQRPLTVDGGEETLVALGLDIIRGSDPGGTRFRRPADDKAKDPASRDLTDKRFADITLGGPMTVSLPSGRELTVEPGQAYLSAEDSPYSVHVPAGQIALELVMADRESASAPAWNRYLKHQPNPNA